jgi:hypothetical protein
MEVMPSNLGVRELPDQAAPHADSQVSVTGWVWDRFEHRAVYDALPDAGAPNPKDGIWLTGSLPKRLTIRGDGPLHRQFVALTGKFHPAPKRGQGHFNHWPASLGVTEIRPAQASPAR